MKDEEIELKEETLLFIKSLESKLNVTEYSELRNIVDKYVQLARNMNWEIERYKDRNRVLEKARDNYFNKCEEAEKTINKLKENYTEPCNKYAKTEIELDIAKAKIQILEGEKK